MPRKVGTIMTALKDKAAFFERECQRLRVRVESLAVENEALKEKLTHCEHCNQPMRAHYCP